MKKNCLCQFEALINSFTFYRKRFLKKPLYKTLWPKRRFFTWNCTPPVGQKSVFPPKIFSRLFILDLALSITKVSTRSECYTWDTSLVRILKEIWISKMSTIRPEIQQIFHKNSTNIRQKDALFLVLFCGLFCSSRRNSHLKIIILIMIFDDIVK